jgi:hypothetical protein
MANRTYELGSREIPDNGMWDMCDHLEPGDTAKAVYCEDDRFGPVGRMAVCDDCHAEREVVPEDKEIHSPEIRMGSFYKEEIIDDLGPDFEDFDYDDEDTYEGRW